MPWPNCDVCGEQAIGVASSVLGPISFAYCKTCLNEGAEVPWTIAFEIAISGGRDKAPPHVLHLIEPSLRRSRLAEEDFNRMVAEYEEDLSRHNGSESLQEMRGDDWQANRPAS